MSRPWWSRPDLLAVAVLLAAGLGAWQATRVAAWLGFGPDGSGAGPNHRPGRPGAPRFESAVALAERHQEALRRDPGEGSPSGPPLEAAQAEEAGTAPQPWDSAAWVPTEEETDGWSSADWDRYLRADAARKSAQAPAARLRGFMEGLRYSAGQREPMQTALVVRDDTWVAPAEPSGAPPPEVEQVSPGAAPSQGGARVVLRGRHLRPSQVMFGVAAARITGATADSVTVEVPPARPGQVVIALTNQDGAFVIVPQPFTYLD